MNTQCLPSQWLTRHSKIAKKSLTQVRAFYYALKKPKVCTFLSLTLAAAHSFPLSIASEKCPPQPNCQILQDWVAALSYWWLGGPRRGRREDELWWIRCMRCLWAKRLGIVLSATPAGISSSCQKFAHDPPKICNLLGNLHYLHSPKITLVNYIILYLPWSFIRNPIA